MEEVGITVVGAGVVGLAVAAELSRRRGEVLVLEKHDGFGRETSSRNSEVIHSGIYYPADSLKARLSVEGKDLLYAYCADHAVPHARIGKLIVAAEEGEIEQLERLADRGANNGVADLALLPAAELGRLEPRVRGRAALLSPSTGILDSHALMKSLHDEAAAAGAIFSFGSEADSVVRREDGWHVGVKGEDFRFLSRAVVNAAGLSSDRVASMAGVDVDAAGYVLHYCKGSYFAYAKPSPVRRLVYPVPEKDLTGLGVHATLDLAGRLRFGPDTEYVDRPEYDVDAAKGDAFFAGADRIIAGLDRDALHPDMAGIRPKIRGEGVKDFVIREESGRGLPGLVNLVGIESPGLTACLAIARMVAGLLEEYI